MHTIDLLKYIPEIPEEKELDLKIKKNRFQLLGRNSIPPNTIVTGLPANWATTVTRALPRSVHVSRKHPIIFFSSDRARSLATIGDTVLVVAS